MTDNLKDREAFEAALSKNSDVRFWNTTDAMFWAWRAAIDAALAARGAVPAGWVMVPVEPTDMMAFAADEHCSAGTAKRCYLAMLAAAPQQVAQQVQPTLLRDLAEELGMSVPALAGAISRKGLGYYSTNMEVTNDVIGAMRADFAQAAQPNLLSWAVDRWLAEVSNRPLVNKNRRTLDDTWRQVIRFAGGDPDELIGPCHDTLLAAAPQKPKD